jgi:hypothetical protein
MTQLFSGGSTAVDERDADDLTADDHLAVETEKAAPDDPDADLPEPDQDPAVIPTSVVDVDGDTL